MKKRGEIDQHRCIWMKMMIILNKDKENEKKIIKRKSREKRFSILTI